MNEIFCECGDELDEHDLGGCNLCDCKLKPSAIVQARVATLEELCRDVAKWRRDNGYMGGVFQRIDAALRGK